MASKRKLLFGTEQKLKYHRIAGSEGSPVAHFIPPSTCVPLIQTMPMFTDVNQDGNWAGECWSNSLFLIPNQPIVTNNSFTMTVDQDETGGFNDGAAEYSSYFGYSGGGAEEVIITTGSPCQPRVCSQGIRLSFDYSVDVEISGVSTGRVQAEWEILVELIDVNLATETLGSAYGAFELSGPLCQGPTCSGGSSSHVESGSGYAELAPGAVPLGNVVGALVYAAPFRGLSAIGADPYHLTGTVALTNFAWELI